MRMILMVDHLTDIPTDFRWLIQLRIQKHLHGFILCWIIILSTNGVWSGVLITQPGSDVHSFTILTASAKHGNLNASTNITVFKIQ